jgi:hypothetical protein
MIRGQVTEPGPLVVSRIRTSARVFPVKLFCKSSVEWRCRPPDNETSLP